jgi:hypothetical protein
MADVDSVEWRYRDGERSPVALVELSRVDGNRAVPWTYLDSVWQRFANRDGQQGFAALVARSLGVPAWLVLFRWDLSEFWMRRLDIMEADWRHLTKTDYEGWVRSL